MMLVGDEKKGRSDKTDPLITYKTILALDGILWKPDRAQNGR